MPVATEVPIACHIAFCSPARQPTTESSSSSGSLKMPDTQATAVHPSNGMSKDSPSMIFQQFGHISKEPEESSRDFLHSSIVKVAATGVVSRCSQPLQELQNQQFRAVPLNGQ